MSLKNKIQKNKKLKDLTTFKIGGKAQYYSEPVDKTELKKIVIFAKNKKLKIYCIGRGSNILASDKGLKGIVIGLSNRNFKKFSFCGNILSAQAGCSLAVLLQQAKKRNLSGLEYFVGIPGSLGGAIVMNAGIKEKNIGDLVEDVTIMDYNGTIKILQKQDLDFGYRCSGLSKVIVLSVRLKLKKSTSSKISSVINKLLNERRRSQEWSSPSAGCVFKNPLGDSAGRLIDLCGLKGRRVGEAEVSFKHANFIINKGNARSSDVIKLIGIIKREVRDKFKTELEPEIKIWR